MLETRNDVATRRDRLLVIMQSENNAALVAASLGEDFEIIRDIALADALESDPDIVLIDGYSLHRHGEEIGRFRRSQEPLYVPVLLLSDRDASEIHSPRLAGVVDDIVKRPLSRAELRMRVTSLMRARSLSRQMADLEAHYENERRVASRFQEAALPFELPRISGLALSAYYSAGQSIATIGGDWYDALVLEDGRVVTTIGDVVGSGLEAAVTMAHVRQVARGVAHIHPDPRMMLDAANRNLNVEGKGRMATAFVAVFDTVTSEFTYANAGHVPPLLRYDDGTVEELPSGGLPLGTFSDAPNLRVGSFPPRATLVLYTDGLVESRRDFLGDRDRLIAAVREGSFLRAIEPARALFEHLIEGIAPDDVAILVVRRTADQRSGLRWDFASDNEGAFRTAKDELLARLQDLGFDETRRSVAEVILAELIGNVVRYAPGHLEIMLEENGRLPVLHVLDHGPSYTYGPRLPVSLMSETGRGLFLIRELSREFNVTERNGGGSHARVVFTK